MAVRLTVLQLATAMRIGDGTTALPDQQMEVLTRLLAVATEQVEHYAPNAPEQTQNEAAIRVASFLYDSPPAASINYTDVLADSGAQSLLRTYRTPRARSLETEGEAPPQTPQTPVVPPTTGPAQPVDLSHYLRVDAQQDFEDSEKLQGMANLGVTELKIGAFADMPVARLADALKVVRLNARGTAHEYFTLRIPAPTPGTNLGVARDADSVIVSSSTGDNATIEGATAAVAGVMLPEDKKKVDLEPDSDLSGQSGKVRRVKSSEDGYELVSLSELLPSESLGRFLTFQFPATSRPANEAIGGRSFGKGSVVTGPPLQLRIGVLFGFRERHGTDRLVQSLESGYWITWGEAEFEVTGPGTVRPVGRTDAAVVYDIPVKFRGDTNAGNLDDKIPEGVQAYSLTLYSPDVHRGELAPVAFSGSYNDLDDKPGPPPPAPANIPHGSAFPRNPVADALFALNGDKIGSWTLEAAPPTGLSPALNAPGNRLLGLNGIAALPNGDFWAISSKDASGHTFFGLDAIVEYDSDRDSYITANNLGFNSRRNVRLAGATAKAVGGLAIAPNGDLYFPLAAPNEGIYFIDVSAAARNENFNARKYKDWPASSRGMRDMAFDRRGHLWVLDDKGTIYQEIPGVTDEFSGWYQPFDWFPTSSVNFYGLAIDDRHHVYVLDQTTKKIYEYNGASWDDGFVFPTSFDRNGNPTDVVGGVQSTRITWLPDENNGALLALSRNSNVLKYSFAVQGIYKRVGSDWTLLARK